MELLLLWLIYVFIEEDLMSSYKTMKGKLENGDWITIFSVSRSHPLYDEMDNYNLEEFSQQVTKDRERLRDYFELSKSNSDYYQDYSSFKDYVQEEEETLAQLRLIDIIKSDSINGFSSLKEIKFEIE